MKKIAIAGALLALTGCVQVDNYNDVIKHPVPAHLAGYWQSKGPQSNMVSPKAIATLVVGEGRGEGIRPHVSRSIVHPLSPKR